MLKKLGFTPSKAELDIWIKLSDDGLYEYIATYVDDLLIVSKHPKKYVDLLVNEHQFKLKGTGPISFHLGCDYKKEDDGTPCYEPAKYLEKMFVSYERMFGVKPTPASSPLTHGDHPEIDATVELDLQQIKMHQSMIGSLQWVVQIGRFDVATAVMTMSSFRAAPRKGHMDRLKRIYGYLYKMDSAKVRVRTSEPDVASIPI